MRAYQVGGAIRDRLLGRPVTDRDWVVVGATPEELLARGFRPVGKDFPVFLHPDSGEEYALARTERKVAPGYTGFTFHASPDVTLEDDLARRDFTVNAMAEDDDGRLIDPFNGRADLEARVLRHVSPAFVEDPVRLLRAARLAATLDFELAPETLDLLRQMVASGEVDALVPERVWGELRKALGSPRPSRFFEVLGACDARERLFPEVDRLFGVPQPPQHHPEVDTGVHTLLVLDQAARLSDDPVVRFAALVHDLGKADTNPNLWPRHHGHEQLGLLRIDELCKRLRVPAEFREMGVLVATYHGHCHRAMELRPATVMKVLLALDSFRRPARLDQFLTACEADARGRTGLEERPYPQAGRFRRAFAAARTVEAGPLVARGLSGRDLGIALREARTRAIATALADR